MKGPFTGRHMAGILVGGFAVIIAVNLLMATLAVGTFGGVVVENSYVASQRFNRWLEAADQSRALGWQPVIEQRPDGHIRAAFAGAAAPGAMTVRGKARHPLGRRSDVELCFVPDAAGGFVSREPLPAGRWIVRLEAEAGGNIWRGESRLP